MPFPEQSVGFITDGIVYNLLRLCIRVVTNILPLVYGCICCQVSCLMSLFRSPVRQAKRNALFKTSSSQGVSASRISSSCSDVPSWWEYSRCGLRIRWGFPLSSCPGRRCEVLHGMPTSSLRRIDMQLLVGVYGLGCIKQVFHELAAQVHIHFFKGALPFTNRLKCFRRAAT